MIQRNARMNTDKANTLFLEIQFKHSKIADEPHLPRLKPGLLPFLVGEQTTRRRAKLHRLDEAFWRMSRQIQNEILVQVCHVRHAALPGQSKHFAFAGDPRIVGASMHINLSDGNYLVSDAALLIVPMISLIASPADFRAGEFERLRQGEGHRVKVDVDEASIQSNDRQPWGMSLLGQQIRNYGQG